MYHPGRNRLSRRSSLPKRIIETEKEKKRHKKAGSGEDSKDCGEKKMKKSV